MIKLYYSPFTRSSRPRFLLEELGVPYELVNVDMKAKQHKAPEYLAKVHPHGAVPACEIDGVTIFESGAIIATIADKHSEKGLAPKLDEPARAVYNQWMFYGYATMEPAVVAVLAARKGGTDDEKVEAEADWADVAAFLDKSLAGKEWILGSAFSAADCVIGAIAAWAASSKLCESYASLQAYAERVKSRPAFTRARK